MGRPRDSGMARYIDRLERQVKQLRPQAGLNPWHLLLGAGTGAAVAFMFGIQPMSHGHDIIPALAASAAACALAFGVAGRLHWNYLLARLLPPLQELARRNLLDHELLLLCMQNDLPAHYEKLRYVAQSYGKTRASNWSELRPNSMLDRVTWLVENYSVICEALDLRAKLPEQAGRQRHYTLLLLLPLGLVGLAVIAMLLPPVRNTLGPGVLFGSLALMILALGAGGGLATQLAKIERSALNRVLVEQLDLTDPTEVEALEAGKDD